jgi:cell division septal protein FtsQ
VSNLLRALAISVTVAVLTTVAIFVVSYLTVPVTGVQVIGARIFPESEVWNAVPDRASLITLNARSLEQKLESNPWVKSAMVTKNWDSGIVTVEVGNAAQCWMAR